MHAVDTNLLVRLFTRDDIGQAERARRFVGIGAWVSHVALVEAVWVLQSAYARKKADLVRAVELTLKNESLVVQEPEVVADALAMFESHNGVSFSDCMLLAVSKKAGHLPLGTFDAKFARLPGTKKI